jgi:hypothetical protein
MYSNIGIQSVWWLHVSTYDYIPEIIPVQKYHKIIRPIIIGRLLSYRQLKFEIIFNLVEIQGHSSALYNQKLNKQYLSLICVQAPYIM